VNYQYGSICLGLLVALAGCGGQAVSATDKSLIAQADQLHARLAPALVEERDPKLKRYLEQLGDRILAAAKECDQQRLITAPPSAAGGSNAWMFSKDVDFHLVDSDLPNTFTSGGRHVYVYNGLFQQCRGEDELASLLCHEYARVYARQVQQEITQTASASTPPGAGGGGDAILARFATMRLSAAEARSADAIAFTIYSRAGWDPTRFASLYQRMLEGAGVASAAEADRAMLREKVIEAQRRTDGLPPAARDWAQPPVADDARFEELRAEARAVVARGGPRNDRIQLLLAAFPSALAPGGETPTQARARQKLFPPPTAGGDNQWGKGLGGTR
jgi:predicted Zn-dependent protease